MIWNTHTAEVTRNKLWNHVGTIYGKIIKTKNIDKPTIAARYISCLSCKKKINNALLNVCVRVCEDDKKNRCERNNTEITQITKKD